MILQDCKVCRLTPDLMKACLPFSCEKEPNIDTFFHSEYDDYNHQLLGKTYCFVSEKNQEIAGAFTVANSSIKMDFIPKKKRNFLNRKIPNEKRRSQYPAVLVAQLAVFDGFHGQNFGTELMDFIKAWFIDPLNKTGCRYIVVDAINKPRVLQYYRDNGFNFIFDNEKDEIDYVRHIVSSKSWIRNILPKWFCAQNTNPEYRKTRLMYFDLITLQQPK